ncbi:MAG: hypothetical protein LLG42_13515 [Chloroflexi bacterium]|nr:hypothetical protein [Chloroflexota bacterium]
MEEFLRFLKQNELWIYVSLGLVLVIYLRKLNSAWQDWKSSLFGLEKENAQRTLRGSLTMVGLLGLMILSEFILISFVVPAYPQSMLLPTPTINLFTTPTGTLNVLSVNVQTDAEDLATQQTNGENGCIPDQLEWLEPTADQEVSGAIILKGTVSLPNMAFYKFEYSASGSNSWVTIAAGNEAKVEAPLGGSWNTKELVPGDYILRLVVTDNLNNQLPPCDISVRVISSE